MSVFNSRNPDVQQLPWKRAGGVFALCGHGFPQQLDNPMSLCVVQKCAGSVCFEFLVCVCVENNGLEVGVC